MSIRLRLGLWYGTLAAVLVAVFGAVVFSTVAAYLREDLRRSTERLADHFVESAQGRTDGASAETLMQAFAAPDVTVAVFDSTGRLLAATPTPPASPGLAPDEGAGTAAGAAPARAERLAPVPRGGYRAERAIAAPNVFSVDEPVRAVVLGWFFTRRLMLDRLLRVLVVSGVLASVAGVFIGWGVAGGALRPVSMMVEAARRIARSQDFRHRLPTAGSRDELGQLTSAFNEMLAELEKAFENQRRFVADASHELRAPLATLQGNLELLERAANLSEAERRAVWRDIRDEVRRLGRLVSDLLSLARAEAGQGLHLLPVELDRVVTDVLRSMRNEVAQHRLVVEHLEPVQVMGDADRLRELLVILLDNAIRYTPPGGEIRVGLGHTPGPEVALSVADTGIGIAPEDLPHIFERFYRADKARSRATGGTGLGLAIARWIVEAHGGRIEVESQPGQGSRFTVRLPAARPASPEAETHT